MEDRCGVRPYAHVRDAGGIGRCRGARHRRQGGRAAAGAHPPAGAETAVWGVRRTQFPRVPAPIPRSRAISTTGLRVSRTIRTAPALNSGSYLRRVCDIAPPHRRCLHDSGGYPHQLRQLQNPSPALRRQTQLGPPRHPHSDLKREEPDNSQQPDQTRQTRRLRVHQLRQLQNPSPALRRQT